MADPKKTGDMLSNEELMKLLLKEDELFHDEGRDLYMDDVLALMRRNLGTDDGFDFGRGKADLAGSFVSEFGRKALVVTGRSTIRTGLRDRILAQLEQNHMEYEVFDGIGSNPLTTSVDEGARVACEAGCDVVLAVGGGSQMDAAKSIALVAGNGGSIKDYTGGRGNDPSLRVLPVVAVPTTCGTGSEMNGISVLTDPETHDKAGVSCKGAVPKVALVDPSVMETMPPSIMSAVSFDAFCHLVEAYVNKLVNEEADAQCLKGLALLSEGLVRANQDIHDQAALDKVVYAASLAGIPIYTKGTVAGHALEHPLSGLRNIVHGRGLAAISPVIYERCVGGAPERFAEISRMFGGNDEHDIRQTTENLLKEIGLETSLYKEGFNDDDVDWLTSSVLRTGGKKLVNNPVKLEEADIRSIYEECM